MARRRTSKTGDLMTLKSDLSNPEAVAISDGLLAITGQALMSRDFPTFFKSFSLPHLITTFDAKRILRTEEDLEFVFDANCDYFAEKQLTDIVRKCMSADFDGPDTVKAMHVTHLMSGSQRIKDPFPSFSVLERQDGVWRVCKSDYAVNADYSLTTALLKLERGDDPKENNAT